VLCSVLDLDSNERLFVLDLDAYGAHRIIVRILSSDPDGPGGPVSGVSLAGPTHRRPGGPGHVCGPHLAGF
jgi:hypothetical protein